ncbi:MAG: hypothetical protein M0Q38_11405 [Bacteroidales bacterium]|jgi:hypothetical protein|nr:hypothetical protein [Bacteroidales bacterium]
MKKSLLFFVAVLFAIVCFSQNQKLVDIKTSQLPKGAIDFVKQNLPGAQIVRAAKMDDKSGTTYVAVTEIKGKKFAYQFDKEGKFLGKADHLVKAQTQGTVAKPPAAGTTIDRKQPVTPMSKPPAKAGETKPVPATPAAETPKK